MRTLTIVILLPILIAALAVTGSKPGDSLPPVMLWAWERPENLTFLDTQKAGVAFLAKTITLRGDKTLVRPRLQPLQLAPDTKVVAVVRIETDRPALSASQLQRTVAEISSLSGVLMVQIDFDATLSERDFYRELLQQVRQQLPSSTRLSMTALASWCAADNWLNDLPVDEAVPMLFRLGVEQRQFQRRLETGQPFESRKCDKAAGVSTDEPVHTPPVDRLYLFNPQPWTKDSFRRALEAYQK